MHPTIKTDAHFLTSFRWISHTCISSVSVRREVTVADGTTDKDGVPDSEAKGRDVEPLL
jgi:hypothetical protein